MLDQFIWIWSFDWYNPTPRAWFSQQSNIFFHNWQLRWTDENVMINSIHSCITNYKIHVVVQLQKRSL